MTGRGKPRKTKPDLSSTRPEETKEASLPTCQGRTLTEKKQNGAKAKSLEEPSKESATTQQDAQTKLLLRTLDKLTIRINEQSEASEVISIVQEIKDQLKKSRHFCQGRTLTEEKQNGAKETKHFCQKAKSLEEPSKERATTQQDAQTELLVRTLDKLTIRTDEQSEASEVNSIIQKIKDQLKKSRHFSQVEQHLNTGSYYENLKISRPDEFDVMMPIPVDRVIIKPFGDVGAFYSVGLKRGKIPLKEFQCEKTLSASKMLRKFRDEVKKSIKKCPEWTMPRKKKGCPAVTITRQVEGVEISLDVVPCLKVKSSWPSFTSGGFQIKNWLGAKAFKNYKHKPYYLVPKYEGRGTVGIDGVLTRDVWRISFSHIEKSMIENHGSGLNCCTENGQRCCRKECLKLLKHLLSLLKKSDPRLFGKFYSYHAKTTLLHACCTRTFDRDWKYSDLNVCFQELLKDFEGHLEKGELNNFFIPAQNLLSSVKKKHCKDLAERIKEEREKGFPIFM